MSASPAHMDPPQGHGFEGRVMGDFRLGGEIACGGMATVYIAHKTGHLGINQPAAVKVIHPHLSRDRDFVEMFLDEARIVSCINHPNVCRVLDFGKAEGTYYLAMEYVMGETWADLLDAMKERPDAQGILPAVAAQVLAQACEGLHAAHEARDAEGRPLNIVHRDISPQNLIVGYDGSVRVLDFGIASAAERLHTTRNGTIKGRFGYMAPEQMRGAVVDRRADIWSLGVLLWEGLAQKRLFKRDTEAETVLAVTQDPLPPLAEVGRPIPAAINRIAQQALARDRDSRYTTTREMGLELSRFASSSLVPVGMAEVSLWMNRLFGDRIEQKRLIMRAAARAAEGDKKSTSMPPPAGDEPGTTRIDGSKRSGSVVLPSVSTVRERAHADPARDSERPLYKRLSGPIVSVLIVLATVIGGGLLALSHEERNEPATSEPTASAPAAAASAPAPKPAALAPVVTSMPATQPAPLARAATPDKTKTTAPATPRVQRPSAESSAEKAATQPRPRSVVKKSSPGLLGMMNIATPGGWAYVYVGGKKLGTTPGHFELPLGTHTLRLRPFGRAPDITRQIKVQVGETLKVKIPLE